MLIQSPSIPAPAAVSSETGLEQENTDNLVQKCVSGDERAWHTLVERYAAIVYSIPRRYKLDEQQAQDVSQITWEKVIGSLKTLQNDDNLQAWIISVAYNATRDYLRAHKEYSELVREMPSLDIEITQLEQADDLYHAIRRLNPREQMFVRLLMDYPDASYEELAALTDMKKTSISHFKERTLEKLRKLLSKSP